MQPRLFSLVSWPFFLAVCASTACADDESLSAKWIGNTSSGHEDWSVHGQATEIYQGYPDFHAPYSGQNSLSPQNQWKNTTSGTLFIGRRLWDGAEVYYNPELYEGGGFSHTYGMAGFPNGEANKSNSYPILTGTGRLFIRQTIGLDGEAETVTAAPNQLAGKRDINNVIVTIGKYAATDIFDTNTYSNAPRTQFLNWSLMNSAAWDFPCNARGYTDGLAVELNHKNWTARYGLFLEPTTLGQSDLTFHGLTNMGQVAEIEERHTLDEKQGKLRLLFFYNRDRQGYFSDALGTGKDITTAIDLTRHYGNSKYGAAINAEQQLTDSTGAFARLSWNNGQTEDWSFTQVDQSMAVGLSINGTSWGRADDVWGIACAVNAVSKNQRTALAQGYFGGIIGDGMLNYSQEIIFETYYSFRLTQYVWLSPDYQFVANPAYNADRGPVNIFAGRLHVEF